MSTHPQRPLGPCVRVWRSLEQHVSHAPNTEQYLRLEKRGVGELSFVCAQKFRFTDASTSLPSSSVLNTPHNPHMKHKNNPKPLARTAWRVQQLYNFAREPEHAFAFAQQHIVRVARSYSGTDVAARPGDSFIAASERPSLCINYAPIPTSYGLLACVLCIRETGQQTKKRQPHTPPATNTHSQNAYGAQFLARV